MKTIDTRRVLASFGLEPKRSAGSRVMEDIAWLGVGAAVGAATVFALKNPTVRGYLSKAKKALPSRDGKAADTPAPMRQKIEPGVTAPPAHA